VSALKSRNPTQTALMQQRLREYQRRGEKYTIRQHFVPRSEISDYLRWAVIVSEDASFYGHEGVDMEEMKEAFRKDLTKKRLVRGGSTITMQLARNLFLSTSKNPLRKLREVIIARRMEDELSKARILELYLNYIEWGDGIFGCEAAAQAYFGTSCANLTPEQAALMAAVIPNPLRRSVRNPSRRVLWKKRWILNTMKKRGVLREETLQDGTGVEEEPDEHPALQEEDVQEALSSFERNTGEPARTPENGL
jgi:monofunctional biosynthetic peptidoglycan transglycosylase